SSPSTRRGAASAACTSSTHSCYPYHLSICDRPAPGPVANRPDEGPAIAVSRADRCGRIATVVNPQPAVLGVAPRRRIIPALVPDLAQLVGLDRLPRRGVIDPQDLGGAQAQDLVLGLGRQLGIPVLLDQVVGDFQPP